MWNSIIITNNQIKNEDIKKIINGKNSSIIIRNFLKKEDCKKIIEKISTMNIERDSKKFNHIGPFLMNYTTKKEKYFDSAEKANEIFNKIFLSEGRLYKTESAQSLHFPAASAALNGCNHHARHRTTW